MRARQNATDLLTLAACAIAIALSGCTTSPQANDGTVPHERVQCIISIRIATPDTIRATTAKIHLDGLYVQDIPLHPSAWHCIYTTPGIHTLRIECDDAIPFQQQVKTTQDETVWIDCELALPPE